MLPRWAWITSAWYSPHRRASSSGRRAFHRGGAGGTSVTAVGVVSNTPVAEVRAICDAVGITTVQLSGAESVDEVRAVGLSTWKAVHVRDGVDLSAAVAAYAPVVDAVVLDTFIPPSLAEPGAPSTGLACVN